MAERLAHGEYVPAALRTLLRTRETDAIVLDLARVAELKQLLRALARGGVLPLLLKGAHLAYSHYARPYLRPKSDTDLLVPPHARDAREAIALERDLVRKVNRHLGTDLVRAVKFVVPRGGILR